VQGNDVVRRKDVEASACGIRMYTTATAEATWSGSGRNMSRGAEGGKWSSEGGGSDKLFSARGGVCPS
jgi:hypothetical protein